MSCPVAVWNMEKFKLTEKLEIDIDLCGCAKVRSWQCRRFFLSFFLNYIVLFTLGESSPLLQYCCQLDRFKCANALEQIGNIIHPCVTGKIPWISEDASLHVGHAGVETEISFICFLSHLFFWVCAVSIFLFLHFTQLLCNMKISNQAKVDLVISGFCNILRMLKEENAIHQLF